MKYIDHLLYLLPLLGAAPLHAQQDTTSLLSDAALTGWHIMVEGQDGEVAVEEQDYFVWEDSLLHVLPRAEAGSEQPFAALVTDSSYASYRLYLEYKWGEKKFAPRNESVRDAGVLFHIYDTSEFWPSGLECQIQEGDTGDAWLIGARATSASTADGKAEQRTGERYVRFSRTYSWEQPGWNSVELEVDGDTASFYVNGHLVNTISKTQQMDAGSGEWVPLQKGHIALQAEGAEVLYRNVRLLPRTEP